MPPCLDIRVLSRRRDRETIERFVRDYVGGDEELMILLPGAGPDTPDAWEFRPPDLPPPPTAISRALTVVQSS